MDEREAIIVDTLRRDPLDDEAWQVLVDLLLERGDPLGELVALDHPFGRHTHVERLRAKLGILRRHADELLGVDGARVRLINEHQAHIVSIRPRSWARIALQIDHGHIVEVGLHSLVEPDPELMAVLLGLLARPISRLVRSLDIRVEAGQEIDDLVEVLSQNALLSQLDLEAGRLATRDATGPFVGVEGRGPR